MDIISVLDFSTVRQIDLKFISFIPLNIESYLNLKSRTKYNLNIYFLDSILVKCKISKLKLKENAFNSVQNYLKKGNHKTEYQIFLKQLFNFYIYQNLITELIDNEFFGTNSQLIVIKDNRIKISAFNLIFDEIYQVWSSSNLEKYCVLIEKKKSMRQLIAGSMSVIANHIYILRTQLGKKHGFNIRTFFKLTKNMRSDSQNLVVLNTSELERSLLYLSQIKQVENIEKFGVSVIDEPISSIFNLISFLTRSNYLRIKLHSKKRIDSSEFDIESFYENIYVKVMAEICSQMEQILKINNVKLLICSTNQTFPLPLFIECANRIGIRTISFPHSPNDEITKFFNSSEIIPYNEDYSEVLKSQGLMNRIYKSNSQFYEQEYKPYKTNIIKNLGQSTKPKILVLIQKIDGGNEILDRDIGYYLEFLMKLNLYVGKNNFDFYIKDHPRMPQGALLNLISKDLSNLVLPDETDLKEILTKVDYVITHLGIGSALSVARYNKKPVYIYADSDMESYIQDTFVMHEAAKKCIFFSEFSEIDNLR